MATLDFSPITEGNVSLLAGQPRGLAARQSLKLDQLDAAAGTVKVVVPAHVTAITTSFVQGLFSGSLKKFKSKGEVVAHYDVSSLPEGIRGDLYAGLDRLFSRRELP